MMEEKNSISANNTQVWLGTIWRMSHSVNCSTYKCGNAWFCSDFLEAFCRGSLLILSMLIMADLAMRASDEERLTL